MMSTTTTFGITLSVDGNNKEGSSMKRTIISAFLLLPILLTFAEAGTGQIGNRGQTDRTVEYTGSETDELNVVYHTTVPIIVSSAAINSGKGIQSWYFREVHNYTNGQLFLQFGEKATYQTFCSSFGVVLSSGSGNIGDAYNYYGEETIWGVSAPGTTSGAIGGAEHYHK